MTLKVAVLIVTLLLTAVGTALAAPTPEYFAEEWAAFMCVAGPPGAPGPVAVQFNFDKVAFGGIPLDRANNLFTYLRSNLGLLSPVLGSNPQLTNCNVVPGQSLNPSQALALAPGLTALQAAQGLSGTFQQLGFSRYIIADVFLSFTVLYSGSVDTLRMEVFDVPGSNNLVFKVSSDIDESLVPQQ